MSIFEDITLSWGDDEYVISGDDKIMQLIARVEKHVSIADLSKGDMPLASLSMGFSEALKFAGATATGAEVYQSLFIKEQAQGATEAVLALLTMMLPPAAYQPKAVAPGK